MTAVLRVEIETAYFQAVKGLWTGDCFKTFISNLVKTHKKSYPEYSMQFFSAGDLA